MDKIVEDILRKSQYGQKGRLISLVNLRMEKNVDDILGKSLYGQKRLDESQYGQIRRAYPQ